MNDAEHKELVKLVEEGGILIGVDRTVARQLFTDVSLTTIQEMTGETPYLEKILIMSAFILGPVALITSVALAFVAFGWWGLISLLLCPGIYGLYQSSSSLGGARLLMITAIVVLAGLLHFSGIFGAPWITGFIAVFLFSLLCIRFVYSGATFMYRAFAIRNRRAFEFLSGGLSIKHVE
jgi:hypothetical protein